MRDASEMKDIDLFLRSRRGRAHLKKLVRRVKGRTVTDVTYSNEGRCIATRLTLDDGSHYVVYEPSLAVYELREEFGEAIEEEYYKELSKRGPERKKP